MARKKFKQLTSGLLSICLIISLISNVGQIRTVEASGTANEAVNIANSQIGYREKVNGNSLDDFTANAGYNNYTKYHRDLGYSQGLAWCGIFVRWVLQSAGVPSSEWPSNAAYVPNWQQLYINKGKYHARGTYQPKPGDLVIIATSEGPRGHIGIIESADSVAFNYISGNTGNNTDRVEKVWMSQSNSKVTGYCEISYVNDVTKPIISNVKVTSITDTGYTIELDATDNVGINRVEFPTWPSYKTSEGCEWYKPTSHSGNHYSFTMNKNWFNGYSGCYNTHIYAFDDAGNSVCYALNWVGPLVHKPAYTMIYGNHKYERYDSQIRWTDAKGIAELKGGYLVTVSSEEENELVKHMIRSCNKKVIWLGATDEKSEGNYKWVTGEEFTFNKFGADQPDNAGGNENYLGMWREGDSHWNDFPDAYYMLGTTGFIVEYENDVELKTEGSWDGHDYIVYNNCINPVEAYKLQKDGWYLASITSKEENDYIQSLILGMKDRIDAYIIGGNDNNSEGTFEWDNGEPFEYSNWDLEEPSNRDGDFGTTENYISIRPNGKWNDISDTTRKGYVLERKSIVESDGIVIDAHVATLNIGEEYTLKATVLPEDTDDKTVTWSSEDESIVTITNEGTIKGISEGTTNIYAETSNGYIDSCIVTVKNNVVYVESIDITDDREDTTNIYEGDVIQLTPVVLPSNASDKTVTWSSSNNGYATVSSSGLVRIKKNIASVGPVDITITAYDSTGNVSKNYDIKVFSKSGYANSEKTSMYSVDPDTGVLHIYGTGSIEKLDEYPWEANNDISSIIIESGITEIGADICKNIPVTSIAVPATVSEISKDSFTGAIEDITFHSNAPKIIDGKKLNIGNNVKVHVPEDATGYDEWNLKTQIINDQPKIGNVVHTHDFTETVTKQATCDEDGTKHYECKTCGEKYDEIIPALGHDYSDYVSDNNATCMEDGTKTSVCSRCGDEITVQDKNSALGHDRVVDAAVAATCHNTGLTEGEHCSRCGAIFKKQTEVPMLQHKYDSGEVTLEPTTFKEGKRIYTCKLCGDTKEEVIPKLEYGAIEDETKVQYISLNKNNISLSKGDVNKLVALVYPDSVENKNVIWNSGNIGVAMVDSEGNIAALGVGRTKITVKTVDGEKMDSCVVTVWGIYDIPDAPIVKDVTIDSIEVEKENDCEYSIDGNNWQTNNMFTDLKENTEYTIYMRRMANNSEYYRASEMSEGTTVKTLSKKKNEDSDSKPTDKPTPKPTNPPIIKSTETPDQHTTEKPTPISNPVSEDGVGTISVDGKILTDVDGEMYYTNEYVILDQLKSNINIADKSSGGKYKITKLTKKSGKVVGGTVTYMKPYNKNCVKVSIPVTVKIGGVIFKVTEVGNNAFKNCKKLTKITIGKNITKIGSKAFYGCKKLKSITIKTTKVKKIGSKAFKGINSKAKFKVPKKKLSKYKKMIKKAKAPKKAKITK